MTAPGGTSRIGHGPRGHRGGARPVRPRARWARDVAAKARRSLPETGLGQGWEPKAIMALTAVLLLFGLLTLHSASSVMAQRGDLPHYHYVARQGFGAAIGIVLLVTCARIPTRWWRRFAHHILAGAVVLLVIIILPFTEAIAPPVNGARRWLRVGVTFQPSDLAKLAVVVWTAALAVRKQPLMRNMRRGLAPFLVGWMLVMVPVALEPDFSTACLIVAVGMSIIFVAGARVGHFVILGAACIPLVGPMLVSGYRGARWDSLLLNPGVTPDGAAFQSYQSLVAIGSGGVTGVGFGEGQQKFGFLPEAHNDFIFAMIGEEWGLVGTVGVILGFFAMIVLGFRIARRARDTFGELLAVGISCLIGFQAFLHIGVGLGVLPATGLSLPFISFGRSNLVTMLAAVGMLVAVAREAPAGEVTRAGEGSG